MPKLPKTQIFYVSQGSAEKLFRRGGKHQHTLVAVIHDTIQQILS